jgi:O-succinylbenzoic acid--CoA ligase
MEIQTPLGWLMEWAEQDPDRVCVVLADGDVSYGDLLRLVNGRAQTVRADVAPLSVVTVPVGFDLSSIVEILAVSLAGAVPLPYTGIRPDLGESARSTDAILVQTSGSTGGPSLVRISSSNIVASTRASRSALGNTEADRWLACLPLSHIAGLSVLWRTLEIGASLVLAPFDDALPDLMTRSEPTIASLVPTMARRLIDTDASLLSSMRLVLVGGAATSRSLLEDAVKQGVTLVATYGMTETTAQTATAVPTDGVDLGQWPPVGIPLDGFTISIVSDKGEDVPLGVVGRIRVDGPSVSPGYFGQPDRIGPFDTNDLGSMDSVGRLTVIGRSDDVIISGGENVSLPSVVATIRNFDGVEEVVAIGMPDAEWGTVVVAMIEGSVDLDDLVRVAKDSLLPHERPKRWSIVDRIPTLESGKPDRDAIRRAMASR